MKCCWNMLFFNIASLTFYKTPTICRHSSSIRKCFFSSPLCVYIFYVCLDLQLLLLVLLHHITVSVARKTANREAMDMKNSFLILYDLYLYFISTVHVTYISLLLSVCFILSSFLFFAAKCSIPCLDARCCCLSISFFLPFLYATTER